MFDLFGRRPTIDYLPPAPSPCELWGHRFEKFDATSIFCPLCGTSKAVKRAAGSPPAK